MKGMLRACAIYSVVTAVLFWRCLVLGEAFIPLRQLEYAQPWAARAKTESRPAWNPLHYDSVGQYWVYRDFATRMLRRGQLPLWNPYQFCGTPFVADNLSAVYYPGNLLHVLLGPDRGAGWNAAVHLMLSALFTWALMRRLGLSESAATVSGLVYAFSLWPITWLHLPPFVATTAWLPALCLALARLNEAPTPPRIVSAAAVVSLVLLAGHLQIALYVLLTGAAFAAWHLRTRRRRLSASLASVVAAVALGCLCAAPQLVPTAELLRYAHRGSRATVEGYAAYVGYAAHPAGLVTLFLPDFFGNPSQPERPYAGFSRAGAYYNYSEGALYVGLLPLLLMIIGFTRLWTRPEAQFASAAALLALLIGFGTPAAAVLYFGVPGFSGSGSPARVFVVWTLAAAILSGLGTDVVLREGSAAVKSVVVWLVFFAAAAIGGATAALSALRILGSVPLSAQELTQQLGLLAVGAAGLAMLAVPARRRIGFVLAVGVVSVDLISHGATYNGTGDPAQFRALPPAFAQAARMAGHDRVAAVNADWNFGGPESVLPPNLATLFGLRDVQGYDSLFPGQYKRWLRDALGVDPSPPEVGNMVFLKAPAEPVLRAGGVRVALSLTAMDVTGAETHQRDGIWLHYFSDAPGRASATADDGRAGQVRWIADEPCRVKLSVSLPAQGNLRLADQFWPGWRAYVTGGPVQIERADGIFRRVRVPAGTSTVEFRYLPASTTVGVYLLCAALALMAGGVTAFSGRPSGVSEGG